ncbi:MAG: phage terminase small subunit [Symbiopectobacterium sp.]|uniref:phage terminase small subunit n=1 Tax=Symbiopectobacterium sp. TaxID=2952789 RepID=UPI0039EC5564
MLTPAQRHFQRVMAERRGQVDEQSDIARTAHEEILHRLRLDMAPLSRVQSDVTKADMKKAMLPAYEGWIDGTIEGDSGRQDEVIATLMVWAIDCQDSALALKLGLYVVKHGLSLPADKFRRDAVTVLAEEVSNPVLTLATTDAEADLSGYTAMLDEVAEIVAGKDMPDEVRAKLCKARAFSRRATCDAETKGEALKLFREAISLNPNAGVKKEIAALARELKKLMPASNQTAVDETAEDGAGQEGAAVTDTVDASGVPPTAASENTAKVSAPTPAAKRTTARKGTRKTGTGKTPRPRKTTKQN